jgi:membrane protein DedA with SNARE-associated domain
MLPFLAATLIGATLWNSFLLWCGIRLRQNWEIVEKYSRYIDIVVVLAGICVLVWFIRSRLKRRQPARADDRPSGQPGQA